LITISPNPLMTQFPEELLRTDLNGQDRHFSEAFAILKHGIAEHAFPSASVAVVHAGVIVALQGFGRFTYESSSPRAAYDTIYDLASLTKVVATTASAMILHDRGRLPLDSSVVDVLPFFAADDDRRSEVTIRMLLTHTSGLPPYERLFLRFVTRDKLLASAMKLPLVNEPGSVTEYSDVGFILLGEILSRIAGESLDSFSTRELFRPLQMLETTFRPQATLLPRIPPTENDRDFRNGIVQGGVNDENAWVLGGVAGHAGLFAPASDLARFAQCMLSGGCGLIRPDTIELFTIQDHTFPGSTRFGLGWDKPTPPSQAGQYFSPRSFGHLGFTGTSLWIDPEKQLAVILLTNRTWPDRSSQKIKEVRPMFHDAIVEATQSGGRG
jgi:CubicO group peptidase (beta-lactamase class C family)